MQVPWNRLGKEPVVVLLDRIFILAEPLVEAYTGGDDDEEKKREAKRRRIEVCNSSEVQKQGVLDLSEAKSYSL